MELRNIPRKELQRYRNGITELGIFYFAGKFIEIELFEFWQQLKQKLIENHEESLCDKVLFEFSIGKRCNMVSDQISG